MLTLFSFINVAYAQGGSGGGNTGAGQINSLYDIFPALSTLINQAYFIMLSIAVLVLAYGIFKFISNADDANARKEGRAFILWAVIGIFIMTSVWGLVNILRNTFDLNEDIPGVPGIVPAALN